MLKIQGVLTEILQGLAGVRLLCLDHRHLILALFDEKLLINGRVVDMLTPLPLTLPFVFKFYVY